MGCMIEGFRQGIRYGSDSERLYFRLKKQGVDVTSADSTPTVQYYDRSGNAIGTAEDLTQVASTGWWYHDLDASNTITWEKGFSYRAELTFVVSSITYVDQAWVDVVMWPYNQPLISTEEIDERNPLWAASRPSSLSDWTETIKEAHLELAKDLRALKDSQGISVYPHRILDRGRLRLIEMAYVEHMIADNIIVVQDEIRERKAAAKRNALNDLNVIWIDRDDDLVMDDDEESSLAITFEH